MHAEVNIGSRISITVHRGALNYYALPFTHGGITIRLDVSIGYITFYASDTVRNPGPGNYVWLINTSGYADVFIDPAQFGRSGTHYIYVALAGNAPLNTYELNSVTGNFASRGIRYHYSIYDIVNYNIYNFRGDYRISSI